MGPIPGMGRPTALEQWTLRGAPARSADQYLVDLENYSTALLDWCVATQILIEIGAGMPTQESLSLSDVEAHVDARMKAVAERRPTRS